MNIEQIDLTEVRTLKKAKTGDSAALTQILAQHGQLIWQTTLMVITPADSAVASYKRYCLDLKDNIRHFSIDQPLLAQLLTGLWNHLILSAKHNQPESASNIDLSATGLATVPLRLRTIFSIQLTGVISSEQMSQLLSIDRQEVTNARFLGLMSILNSSVFSNEISDLREVLEQVAGDESLDPSTWSVSLSDATRRRVQLAFDNAKLNRSESNDEAPLNPTLAPYVEFKNVKKMARSMLLGVGIAIGAIALIVVSQFVAPPDQSIVRHTQLGTLIEFHQTALQDPETSSGTIFIPEGQQTVVVEHLRNSTSSLGTPSHMEVYEKIRIRGYRADDVSIITYASEPGVTTVLSSAMALDDLLVLTKVRLAKETSIE